MESPRWQELESQPESLIFPSLYSESGVRDLVSREERRVKEWELNQCSPEAEERTQLASSYHACLKSLFKGTRFWKEEEGKWRKESKRRPPADVWLNLTWERISVSFISHWDADFFPSFLDSVRLPRIARIIRIYTENKLRWSDLRK